MPTCVTPFTCGKRLGKSPEAATFVKEKFRNPRAHFQCSHMPRFGTNGWRTPQEIPDTVGFLLDPESPVNR